MVNVSRSPLSRSPTLIPPLPAESIVPSASKIASATPTSWSRAELLSTRTTAFALETRSGLNVSPRSNRISEMAMSFQSNRRRWMPLTGDQLNFCVTISAGSDREKKSAANTKKNRRNMEFTSDSRVARRSRRGSRRAASSRAVRISRLGRRNRRGVEGRRRGGRPRVPQPAVPVAVEKVDDGADREPPDETPPGGRRQVVDQPERTDDSERRKENGPEGNPKRALAVRILEPQNGDPDADEDEREQRPDVGQVHHLVERREHCRDADGDAGQDCRHVRGAELRVYPG